MRYVYPGDLILGPDGNPAPGATYRIYDDLVAGVEVTDLTLLDGINPPAINDAGVKVADGDGERPHLRGPNGYVGRLYCDTGTGQRYEMNPDDRLDSLLVSGALLTADQTWTGTQTFSGGIETPPGAFSTDQVAGLDAAIAAARNEGLVAQQQVLLRVRSVNNITPDTLGNVTIATGGGGGGGSVDSVNSKTPDVSGNVTLVKGDIGLALVDNTADLSKPISTATQTALDSKAADVEISTANATSIASTVRNLISGRRLYEAFVSFFTSFGQYYTVYHNGTSWPALSTVPAAYIATGRPIIWNSEPYLAATEPSEARNGDLWDKRVA